MNRFFYLNPKLYTLKHIEYSTSASKTILITFLTWQTILNVSFNGTTLATT